MLSGKWEGENFSLLIYSVGWFMASAVKEYNKLSSIVVGNIISLLPYLFHVSFKKTTNKTTKTKCFLIFNNTGETEVLPLSSDPPLHHKSRCLKYDLTLL